MIRIDPTKTQNFSSESQKDAPQKTPLNASSLLTHRVTSPSSDHSCMKEGEKIYFSATKVLNKASATLSEPFQTVPSIALASLLPSDADFEQGVSYEKSGNLEQSFLCYKIAAEKGHAGAQYRLGLLYYRGKRIAKEYETAVAWFRRAAEQGHDRAQYYLGHCYGSGRGVKKELPAALVWLNKAAEQNCVDAKNALGILYTNEISIKNTKEALEWFSQAAKEGHPDAQNNLGIFYNHHVDSHCFTDARGMHIHHSAAFWRAIRSRSIGWFRLAAEQGHSDAQFNLAACYYRGDGVKQDYSEALLWYRKAAEQEHADAQFNLAVCYFQGKGGKQNYAEALLWCRKAAEQGHLTAQFNLSVFMSRINK